MSLPITKHFSLDEFACHNGDPYPADWIHDRLKPLCDALELIRTACGNRPITITSGYRSPEYNAARARNSKGVAKDSQHIHGRAADFAVEGMAPSDVYAIVLRLDTQGVIRIGGAGRYRGWCHVDVRERVGGRLARWTGEGVTTAAV